MNEPTRIAVALDMTFPNRPAIRATGSGVYARSLISALAVHTDVAATPISGPDGPPRTILWLAAGVRRTLRRLNVDLVHCPAFVAPWAPGVPMVITIHDAGAVLFPSHFPAEWRLYNRYVLPAVAAQAAAVVTGTATAREDIIRHYRIHPERVTVIPYGVDDRFRSAPDASLVAQLRDRLAPGAPLALFSGSPGPRKNLDVVLRCLASAPTGDLLRDVRLVISANTGSVNRDYLGYIQEHGLSQRVHWLDRVPPEEMPALYAAADVLLYPSIYEGFGLPPLEAMSVGTPVIAARASCLPEVLGDAAILVDPHDDRALGDAIRSILRDGRLGQALVERGRTRASTFTWARCARQTADLYTRVLAG